MIAVNLPDALSNSCSSCSDAQKRIADKLSHHLIDHRPADWALLEAKYDPTGGYRERYVQHQEKFGATSSREQQQQLSGKDEGKDA